MADQDTLFGDTTPELAPHQRPGAAARAVRDRAIAQVDAHADASVKNRILEGIREVAVVHQELTADDIWKALAEWGIDLTAVERRVLGAMMKKAQAAGWIVPTDRFASSERVEAHAGPKRIWKSGLWK